MHPDDRDWNGDPITNVDTRLYRGVIALVVRKPGTATVVACSSVNFYADMQIHRIVGWSKNKRSYGNSQWCTFQQEPGKEFQKGIIILELSLIFVSSFPISKAEDRNLEFSLEAKLFSVEILPSRSSETS